MPETFQPRRDEPDSASPALAESAQGDHMRPELTMASYPAVRASTELKRPGAVEIESTPEDPGRPETAQEKFSAKRLVGSAVQHLTRILITSLKYFSGAMLMGTMILGCADVIGRYFLGAPIDGALELTEILLAGLIFSGLPILTLRRGHVTLDLLDAVTPTWLLRLQNQIAHVLCSAAMLYLAWVLFTRATYLASVGETTAILKLPVYPLAYGMSGFLVLSGIGMLIVGFFPAVSLHGEGGKND